MTQVATYQEEKIGENPWIGGIPGALWSTGPAPRSPLDFARILHRVAAYCVVQATDWNYLLLLSKRPLAANFWCCGRPMTEKARRLAGLVMAPLLILMGLWLCLSNLSGGIFWVGSFLALVGGLWLVSDRFDF